MINDILIMLVNFKVELAAVFVLLGFCAAEEGSGVRCRIREENNMKRN